MLVTRWTTSLSVTCTLIPQFQREKLDHYFLPLLGFELQSLQVLKDIIIPSNGNQKNLQCSITGQLNAWLITVYLTATVLYSWHPKLATYHKKTIPIRVKKKLHILPDYQNSCRIYLIESFGAQD